jgi:hypothetical protein
MSMEQSPLGRNTHVQVDIGFDDAITPESVLWNFPTVFELPAPALQRQGYTSSRMGNLRGSPTKPPMPNARGAAVCPPFER